MPLGVPESLCPSYYERIAKFHISNLEKLLQNNPTCSRFPDGFVDGVTLSETNYCCSVECPFAFTQSFSQVGQCMLNRPTRYSE